MKAEDYPALFRAAEAASRSAQGAHLFSIKAFAALSIGGAGLATYGIQARQAAVAGALFFLGSLFLSAFMAFRKFEGTWYRARALAESIKTSTWKMMMRAEPFDDPDVLVVKGKFRDLLQRLLNEHRDLAHEFSGAAANQDPLTDKMLAVRELPLEERMRFYRTHRIDDQGGWYADKAGANKRGGQLWFMALILCQAGAITCTLLRIAEPARQYWPTEIFVVAAASILSWTQTKRFRELSAAYTLAAHEIAFARNELDDVTPDEPTFSRFVSNMENAFSREHTQWAARRE
ncbi:DUF4231 domain-containing protein [Longimicrobium sp.]|uniref:DUF4231 domain-containing protein n=1 Tax=Longimicrobium sp. TaxID=2029185 RepID=UPI002E3703B2|nr:DUF4231 domain-containing protein [Longimicrobium sp.]HEX6041067.1 DUF4231 domain-containing protein [Longimicrobium sp.]